MQNSVHKTDDYGYMTFMGCGDRDWRLGLGIGIEIWDQGIWIRDWDGGLWIGNQDWGLELGDVIWY